MILRESYVVKNVVNKRKEQDLFMTLMSANLTLICGAEGRTRTGTVLLPVDFESTTSANSITSAYERLTLQNELYNSHRSLSI
jgi:hypothetical protein